MKSTSRASRAQQHGAGTGGRRTAPGTCYRRPSCPILTLLPKSPSTAPVATGSWGEIPERISMNLSARRPVSTSCRIRRPSRTTASRTDNGEPFRRFGSDSLGYYSAKCHSMCLWCSVTTGHASWPISPWYRSMSHSTLGHGDSGQATLPASTFTCEAIARGHLGHLSAATSNRDPPVPGRSTPLGDLPCPGRGGRSPGQRCSMVGREGLPSLPALRHPRPRVRQGPLRGLWPRATDPLLLQGPGHLPLLQHPAHGGARRPPHGSRSAPPRRQAVGPLSPKAPPALPASQP